MIMMLIKTAGNVLASCSVVRATQIGGEKALRKVSPLR